MVLGQKVSASVILIKVTGSQCAKHTEGGRRELAPLSSAHRLVLSNNNNNNNNARTMFMVLSS